MPSYQKLAGIYVWERARGESEPFVHSGRFTGEGCGGSVNGKGSWGEDEEGVHETECHAGTEEEAEAEAEGCGKHKSE
ncbi:hypothetical protein CCACVL1_05419 [Corchorus capsularis]|uniref:Uncharacterized protein n=1 Tax=Corchorus capsularis TaxID=210143 RepID=A0A1R3JKS8_COCAP|nr:hypothetical protein CCACVL1_05419 [Corchorus capsularis]